MSFEKGAPRDSPLLKPPVSIVCRTTAYYVDPLTNGSVTTTNSGAMTANTEKTLLTVFGEGVVQYLTLRVLDATARTASVKLLIDGRIVFSASAATSTTDDGWVMIGGFLRTASGYIPQFAAIPFRDSVILRATSTITETDKLGYQSMYYKTF